MRVSKVAHRPAGRAALIVLLTLATRQARPGRQRFRAAQPAALLRLPRRGPARGTRIQGGTRSDHRRFRHHLHRHQPLRHLDGARPHAGGAPHPRDPGPRPARGGVEDRRLQGRGQELGDGAARARPGGRDQAGRDAEGNSLRRRAVDEEDHLPGQGGLPGRQGPPRRQVGRHRRRGEDREGRDDREGQGRGQEVRPQLPQDLGRRARLVRQAGRRPLYRQRDAAQGGEQRGARPGSHHLRDEVRGAAVDPRRPRGPQDHGPGVEDRPHRTAHGQSQEAPGGGALRGDGAPVRRQRRLQPEPSDRARSEPRRARRRPGKRDSRRPRDRGREPRRGRDPDFVGGAAGALSQAAEPAGGVPRRGAAARRPHGRRANWSR